MLLFIQVGVFVNIILRVKIVTSARKDFTVTLYKERLSIVNCVRVPTREVAFWSAKTRSSVWNVLKDTEVDNKPIFILRSDSYTIRAFLQVPNVTFAATVTSVIRPERTARSAFVNRATVIRTSIRTRSETATAPPEIVSNVSTIRVDRSAINVYRVRNNYSILAEMRLKIFIIILSPTEMRRIFRRRSKSRKRRL